MRTQSNHTYLHGSTKIEPLLMFISSQRLSSSESLQHTVRSECIFRRCCLLLRVFDKDKYSTDVCSVQAI